MHEMYSTNICNTKEKRPSRTSIGTGRNKGGIIAVLIVIAVAALLGLSGGAIALEAAQGGSAAPQDCRKSGKNGECNQFGEIWMDTRKDVKGERVDLKTDIMLYTDFSDQNARWVMFSVRNISQELGHPVDVQLNSFRTEHGNVVTTREDYQDHRVDLWVDVLDLPVNTPITITMNVGSTERGAFDLETMVLAFDRGYDPIRMAGGKQASLFAYTTLSVTDETGSSGFISRVQNVPGFEAVAVLGALAAVAIALARGRSR